MPQRASVFCNFYIRVDREALVSERALDVGSVALKAMSTKISLPYQTAFSFLFFDFLFIAIHECFQNLQFQKPGIPQKSITGPQVSTVVKKLY
jgi:hypothetical protein